MLDRLTWGHFISVQLRRRISTAAQGRRNKFSDPSGLQGVSCNDLLGKAISRNTVELSPTAWRGAFTYEGFCG